MNKKELIWCILSGAGAGAVTGLFGGGGGLVLVPLLGAKTGMDEEGLFPASVSVILPVCLVCLFFRSRQGALPLSTALPYLLGSGLGGILCGIFGKRIPVLWLHRLLGIMILWGGVRYLC